MSYTFEDYIASAGLSERTEETYSRFWGYVEAFMIDHDLTAETLTPKDFKAFLDTRTWSNSTERNCLCAVKAFVGWAFDDHPMRKMKLKKKDPGPQRTLDQDQVHQLLGGIDLTTRSGERDLPMLLLLLDTGLRASELCRLEIEHLDLDNCRLAVEQKGGKWRYPVFSDITRSYLEAWLKRREGYAQPDVKTVFVSVGGGRPGTPLTRDGLRSVFRYLGERAGLGLLSPHDIRRTFATDAVRRNVNPVLIASQGGWTDVKMVAHYARAITPEAYRGHFANWASVEGSHARG